MVKALEQVGCVHSLNWNPLSKCLEEKIAHKSNTRVWMNTRPIRSSDSSSSLGGGGVVRREVLSNQGRTKLDSSSDRSFYAFPRLVKHVDDQFLATLTALYRERIPEGAEVLDLCSSWQSYVL
ncbi:hypothetical protein R1flu_001172 [Riccia fluitans]|uniref:Uncharacterized protein n=1 Tax=Riccia fluitans TaxID=41844 RepID=A0ABD1Y2K1_9MARC